MAVEKRLVTIVDDDPSMLKGVGRLLNAHGFVAEVYTSAEAFLQRATGSEPSCLLLDINLGGISGIELQRKLLAAGPKIPIIFMTAIDNDMLKNEAIAAGCIAYLHKPFPSHQLIEAIGKLKG
jgi:FixJ family two-component response regulator